VCPNSKDLYLYLAEMDRAKGVQFGPLSSVRKSTFFFPPSPSQSSSLQVFKYSSPETEQAEVGINDDEKLGIVSPYVVTAKGTGNRQSFMLARAIRHRKFSEAEIAAIFRMWWEKSRQLLPPHANYDRSLGHFYSQLLRVRFTDAGLKAACECARKAKPPFIPARDGDEQLARLAALHRELQRDARDRTYICPVGVVVDFLGLRWRSQAEWLLRVLEEEQVIECVDRGEPNKPGKKGKPTLWRYKLPLA
jgi:hypothetical protein